MSVSLRVLPSAAVCVCRLWQAAATIPATGRQSAALAALREPPTRFFSWEDKRRAQGWHKGRSKQHHLYSIVSSATKFPVCPCIVQKPSLAHHATHHTHFMPYSSWDKDLYACMQHPHSYCTPLLLMLATSPNEHPANTYMEYMPAAFVISLCVSKST